MLDILDQVFFQPNRESLKFQYEENLTLLRGYPYIFGDAAPAFDSLRFRLYPINELAFGVFDCQEKRFLPLYEPTTEDNVPYFFKDLDKPLLVEDNCNYFHLQFLSDTVRLSQDYGADNHIYLYYTSFDSIAKLLITTSLTPLLKQEKFVFLIGEKQKSLYPLDFMQTFGIDYTKTIPKPIKLSEINRIIMGWYIIGSTGSKLLGSIIDNHPNLLNIQAISLNNFYMFYEDVLENKDLATVISNMENRRLSNASHQMLQQIFKNCGFGIKAFTKKLNRCLADYPNPTFHQWFTAFFLSYALCLKRDLNARIAPAIFYHPHVFLFEGTNEYAKNNLLLDAFKYVKIISIIRDPITTAGSILNFYTHSPLGTNIFAAVDNLVVHYNGYYRDPREKYFKHWKSVRFEDLKLNLYATTIRMAEFFNIPHTNTLLQSTVNGIDENGQSTDGSTLQSGLDKAPVYKKYESLLSEYDKYRLELIKHTYYAPWGYQCKYYDGKQYNDSELLKMMAEPFHCEQADQAYPKEFLDKFRQNFAFGCLYLLRNPIFVSSDGTRYKPNSWLIPSKEDLYEPLYDSVLLNDSTGKDE